MIVLTNRERVDAVLNFQSADRMPVTEWAPWWDMTLERWYGEGLPRNVDIYRYFGLERLRQFWFRHTSPGCPEPASHGAGIMKDEKDYEKIRPYLYYKGAVNDIREEIKAFKPLHDRGDCAAWFTLNGFFWFPRTLFGIEGHFFAFYDYPELYHRICEDMTAYYTRIIEEFCDILTPDYMTFAEDMSYNHGPMLSRELYDEFIRPYYRKLVPLLRQHGIKVFVDSDGDVLKMIPWLQEGGIEGVLPLERQAGVDVNEIRRRYPRFLMIGGYNKLVMKDGEDAMRKEFERLMPAMRSGGFIPSVDHQTPPEVSLENYKLYLRLFREYAEMGR